MNDQAANRLHNNPPEPIQWKELPADKLYQDDMIDLVLESIKLEATNFTPDTSTDKGRKEIASRAYAVSTSKTFLDTKGVELVEDYKKITKTIDGKRKTYRDTLDSIRDDIRAPLTQWEQEDKNRQEQHKNAFARIQSFVVYPDGITVEEIDYRISALLEYSNYDWQEFAEDAKPEYQRVLERLNEKRDFVVKQAEQQAELEKLRQEKDARDKAEAAAKAAQDAKDIAARIEQERIDREAKIAEQAKKDAEDAAKKREDDLRREADEANQRAEKAAQAERDRIALEELEKKKQQEAREANKRHVNKINKEAIVALSVAVPDLEMGYCEKVIQAIADGKIPNVTIKY